MEIWEGDIRLGDNTLRDLQNSSDDTKAEFNNWLPFIQNNCQFKTINVKFIFDTACLSASWGDKRLFRCANIIQITDVIRRVVFLLFLLCFQQIVRLFLTLERSEVFGPFEVTTKLTQPRHPGLALLRATIDITAGFTIRYFYKLFRVINHKLHVITTLRKLIYFFLQDMFWFFTRMRVKWILTSRSQPSTCFKS